MPNKIRQIIQNKLVEENIKIDNYALSKLEMAVGTDLWLLKNSLEKLVLLVEAENRSQILPGDIDQAVSAQNETKIFDLSDALIRRNLARSLELLRSLLKGGDNELQIFSFIVSQYRTLLIICDLSKQGKTSGEIASLTKMHPFVIKKNIELARHCPLARASAVYRLLQEYDVKLKTGYGEPEVLLTMLMNKITSSH
jgi:DNA polymerase-3 subunit delta